MGDSHPIDSTDHARAAVLHCNRAACWQHQRQYLEALRDAAIALTLDSSSVRAAQRSAAALMAVGEFGFRTLTATVTQVGVG